MSLPGWVQKAVDICLLVWRCGNMRVQWSGKNDRQDERKRKMS